MRVPRSARSDDTSPPESGLPADRRGFLRLAGVTAICAGAAGTVPLAARTLGRLTAPAGLGAGTAPAGLGAGTALAGAVRPPATPLAVRSPYLSTWLQADQLAGTWATFWNGHATSLCGLVRVDGDTYIWCGAPGGNYPPVVQESLELTATRSVFTLRAGPVTLTATFFSPVDPQNLRRQSVPMSYITVTAAANDGGHHTVQVYLDSSAEWVHGDMTAPVIWSQQETGGLNVITATPSRPSKLAEYHDQASWGTLVWATDSVPGLSWQTGWDEVVRTNAARGALPNTNDTRQPRAVNDQWPVFGFLRDLGTVGTQPSPELVICVGHARRPAVSYLGALLAPYWSTFWPAWPGMLAWFRQDLPAALATCTATDAAVRQWAGQHPGMTAETADQYAAITALSLRQAFGATELVVGPGGEPWAFLKEISSGGKVSTLDVMFAASPAYLQLSPAYLQMLLAPVLDYAGRAGSTQSRWAGHDIGPDYPRATGPSDLEMPIEESANGIVLAAAVMSRLTAADAASYARTHYPVLRRWAEYLMSQEPDYPGQQRAPGDVTGGLARSVSLNLTGIVGIGAFSQVAGHAGESADQAAYAAAARRCAVRWAGLSTDPSGRELDLTYGGAESFGLNVGGYPDRLLNLNLVTPDVQALQAAVCLAQARPYGVPGESGQPYTTVDAEMLTAAAVYAHPAARDLLTGKVFTFANTTPGRVPFADLCDTLTGTRGLYVARPLVGAMFALDTLRSAPNGLTGYWSFGSGRTLDGSGHGRHLSLAGGARVRGGALSLALAGAGAHASSGAPVVRTDTGFTVTAWVKLARRGAGQTAVSQDGARMSAFTLGYAADADRWAFVMADADEAGAAGSRALSHGAPATGRWVQLTGVYDDAAGQLRLYVDGMAQQAVACAGAWNGCGVLAVGRGLVDGRPGGFFAGAIGEVRTYRHALNGTEVAALAALPARLLASYAADERAGATVTDQAGGHTLRLRGTRWADGVAGLRGDQGGHGPGLAFNGGSAEASTAAFLATMGDFSVSAWVRLGDTSRTRTVMSQDGTWTSAFLLRYDRENDAWVFAMTAADATSAPVTRALAPLPPRTGDWQHLTGVHDARAGQLRLYVDGRRAGTAEYGSGWDARGAFVLGRGLADGLGADWFCGGIDQVRVWGRALSDADVTVLV